MTSPAGTLLFNPRCSKARAARALLEERGIEFTIRPYLDEPLDRAELEALLRKLGTDDPRVLVRSKEAEYAELGLDGADRDRLLDALAVHPKLLERPVWIRGDAAVVARPPERLLELLP